MMEWMRNPTVTQMRLAQRLRYEATNLEKNGIMVNGGELDAALEDAHKKARVELDRFFGNLRNA